MLAFPRILRPPPIAFFFFCGANSVFCPPTPLPWSDLLVRRFEVMEAFAVAGQRHESPLQRHLLQAAQEEVPETKQIRREQQWGVAIYVYETIGHELLVEFPRPITGLVSKRPQAFSFSSLSGTARRAAPQNIFPRRNSSC